MLTIILRALLIYILVLFVFRLMGKRQLGQMQPFELVLTLIIADLATIPMAELSVPVLHGVVPLLTLVVVHYFLTLVGKMSVKIGNFINGKPIIVINPDGIDEKALHTLNISIDDLFEAIRSAGYFNLEEIQYAIMETNGTVNVLPKAEYSPVTNGDMKIKAEETTIPVTLVSEGTLMKNNLELVGLNKSFIEKVMKMANISKISDIIVLTLNYNGKVYVQGKKSSFKTFENVEVGK